MIKWIAGAIVLFALIAWGSYALVDWAFDTDVRNAEAACAELGAAPRYTYRTRYICVTPDGRVVE
jgi:hypothetical protein